MKQKESQVLVLDTVRAMSDEELRVKVAELCGYRMVQFPYAFPSIEMLSQRFPREVLETLIGVDYEPIPDYPRDLNAMHEAENVLRDKQNAWFMHHLAVLTGWDRDVTDIQQFGEYSWSMLHATARQRAEAFVLTLSGSNTGTSGEENREGQEPTHSYLTRSL